MRKLTLKDRRRLEEMWEANASQVEIAAELGICQDTVYKELKRGQVKDEDGDLVLDRNFRPKYSAELGEMTYQRNLRNRGRRAVAK